MLYFYVTGSAGCSHQHLHKRRGDVLSYHKTIAVTPLNDRNFPAPLRSYGPRSCMQFVVDGNIFMRHVTTEHHKPNQSQPLHHMCSQCFSQLTHPLAPGHAATDLVNTFPHTCWGRPASQFAFSRQAPPLTFTVLPQGCIQCPAL